MCALWRGLIVSVSPIAYQSWSLRPRFEKYRDNFLNKFSGVQYITQLRRSVLLRRDNIHIVNQRRQFPRVGDGANDHRLGASADLDFLLREAGLVPEAWDGDAGPGASAATWRHRLMGRLEAGRIRRSNPRADLLLLPAVLHSRVVAVRARKAAG